MAFAALCRRCALEAAFPDDATPVPFPSVRWMLLKAHMCSEAFASFADDRHRFFRYASLSQTGSWTPHFAGQRVTRLVIAERALSASRPGLATDFND